MRSAKWRNSQLRERIIPFTLPYLQEIRTATAGEIFLVLARLAMLWTVVQYQSVDLKTATLWVACPQEVSEASSLFRICSGSISCEIARTSRSYCCSAKQESVQHLQQWPHGYRIKIKITSEHSNWKYQKFSQYQWIIWWIAILLIHKN